MNRRWLAGGLAALVLTLGGPALAPQVRAATPDVPAAPAQGQADRPERPARVLLGLPGQAVAHRAVKHRALVRVLSELSGKSPEEVAELLRSGKSREEVLKELGVSPAEVRERLQQLREEWHQQGQAPGQGAENLRHRRAVVVALSRLTGKSPEEIAALWTEGKRLEDLLAELKVDPQDLRKELRALWQPHKQRPEAREGARGQGIGAPYRAVPTRAAGE
ncbi:MAG: hypothetical protein L6E13_11240 [Firmicutes bacterium]|nr:hypothetical protein [Bacillota bacterium]